jgi:DNA replication licensing factor MCM6
MEAFGGFLLDEKAVRVENIFLDFLKSFRMGGEGEVYYEAEIEAMVANESTTMFIDFSHVMLFNNLLQKAISDEFLRSVLFFFLFKFSQNPNPNSLSQIDCCSN